MWLKAPLKLSNDRLGVSYTNKLIITATLMTRTPKVPKRGGQGVSTSSRKRYRKKLLSCANWAFGGAWKFEEVSPGRVVLVDTTFKVARSAIHQNAMEMCKVRRYAHLSGGLTRDVAHGRSVPWSCVTAAWEWLKGPSPERPVSFSALGFPFAMVNFQAKFEHLLQCMERGWTQPAWPRAGELWVRWGVDGVPRWSISYVTLTIALTGKHEDFKLHSVDRFGHCALLCGTESVDSVTALFRATDLNDSLHKLEGSMVVIAGQQLRVRSFILGDHMLKAYRCLL